MAGLEGKLILNIAILSCNESYIPAILYYNWIYYILYGIMDINRITLQQPPHLSALVIGKPLGIYVPLSCNLTEVAVITKFKFGIKVILAILIRNYRITLNNPTLIGIDREPIPSTHRVKVIDYIRALAILNILISSGALSLEGNWILFNPLLTTALLV